MKRMRNMLPSAESQKPSTWSRSLEPAFPKEPATEASVNGFRARGESMYTETSTKSYADTAGADCENTILDRTCLSFTRWVLSGKKKMTCSNTRRTGFPPKADRKSVG